jgi:hypothetical protein
MANPNIAAISELHVGTLGFNLKTNGVTFLHPRLNASGTTTSWDHPVATSIYGYTAANFLVLCAQSYDSGRSTTGIEYNWEAMTKIYGSSEVESSQQRGALYYRVGPDIGNYDVQATMGGSGNFSSISSMFCNVDQTNPLKTFDGAIYQTSRASTGGMGKYPFDAGGTSGWTSGVLDERMEGPTAQLWNMMDQACEPGDIGIFTGHNDEGYGGYIGGPNTHLIAHTQGSSGHRDSSQQFIISPDGGKNIVTNGRFSHFMGGKKNGNSDGQIVSLIILQSSRTEDTLFECPADRVLKINSIMATNPEIANTFVNVSLAGLGAVNDTAGSAAVTPTGNDASVRIAQGVRVPMGKAVELLERPIYMVEGDSLTANAKTTGFMPHDNQRDVDIVVSFESMED